MHVRTPVLLALCVSILSVSAACTDTVGPETGPDAPELLQSVTSVIVTPSQATLSTGSHMAMQVTPIGPGGQPVAAIVKWSSSDPKIATVSDSGYVIALAPGTAMITATAGGAHAAVPFTIVNPVDSVTVAPEKADVAVGQSVQLATMSSGAAATTGVTWVSSDPQVATVSSTGLVTGVTAGIASIRATYYGRTAVAAVTVLVPPPATPPAAEPGAPADGSGASGLWTHQPSGLSTITEQSWNSIPSLGWNLDWDQQYSRKIYVVADPTAPLSDPTVLQFNYNKGFVGGSGPGTVSYRLSASELYLGFYWKMSPNWQGHTSSYNKLFYVFQRNGDDRQAIFMFARGRDAPYHLEISNEPDGASSLTQNVDNVTILPGQWYKIEMHLKRSSSDGAPNGIVEWWVNGKLAARYTNAKLRDESFSEVHIDPVWGGAEHVVKQHDDYFRFGRFHISGR